MAVLNVPESTWIGLSERATTQSTTVEQLVLPLLADLAAGGGKPPEQLTPAERSERMRAWIATLPVRDIVIDDDRDTIYGGPDGRGTW